MPQFDIRLSDRQLRPNDEASVRAFAEEVERVAFPSSSKMYGLVLRELLRSDGFDRCAVARCLRLIAAQRMVLYIDRLGGTPELPKWMDWLEQLDQLNNLADDTEEEELELAKQELRLSVELIQHATSLISKDRAAAGVLYASGSEVGEAADIRTVSETSACVQRAKAIAKIAKDNSYDELSDAPPPKPLRWQHIKAALFRR